MNNREKKTTEVGDTAIKVPGFDKPGLILLAARPGMGKTTFALNLARTVAKNRTVAVFSLEMSREQLSAGFFPSAELMENDRIYIDDTPAPSVADIYAKCRHLDNLGLVVIDYLQLMVHSKAQKRDRETRRQVMTEISQRLNTMAKELNVPVLCLSQLSRTLEKREDRRPVLSDLQESADIVQTADMVLFLSRDNYYNGNSHKRGLAEYIIAKNCHGGTGIITSCRKLEYIILQKSSVSQKADGKILPRRNHREIL